MATPSSSEPTDDQTTETVATPLEKSVEEQTPPVASNETAEAPTAPPADPAPVQPTVVFVQAPQPPKKRGARGVGAVVALFGAALFAAAYALLVLLIAAVSSLSGVAPALQYFSSVTFYVPVIVFFLAYLLLVVVVNRGGWWAHVLGGFIVAIIVWVGFVGAAIIAAGAFGSSSDVVSAVVLQQLANPLGFAAAIAAREVPIWVGGLVSRRGRVARARNAEALTAYEQKLADHRATLGANAAV